MIGLGFQVGKASPCNFHHPRMDITCTVHGDDFTSCGPEYAVAWFQKKIEAKYESKHSTFGPGKGHESSIRVLNRVLTWTAQGITYEADQRHADIIIQELGLEKAKSVVTPSCREDMDKMLENMGDELSPKEATQYRALAARLNYLAQDRADI